ncbi:MAG: hypothetical protein GY944_27190 [bacterium]|nr:hypothetical protein [bacterium]MCP5044731.1 hypothetical protein [bacterium]
MQRLRQERRLRRLCFVGIFFLVPWPLWVLQDAFVPAARYVLLGGVAATVALFEGAAGPVRQIVLLFLGWGALTSALSWGLAWAFARLAGALPDRTALLTTYSLLTAGLVWALFFEPYRTPFGRAVRGGLLQVLS